MAVYASLNSDQLSQFDRLIPPGGLSIGTYHMAFVDANDMAESERWRSKIALRTSSYWSTLRQEAHNLQMGFKIARRCGVYALHNGNVVGRSVLCEYLDNPDGYGEGDFYHAKFVYPEYHHSFQTRCLISGIIHLMLQSGIASNLYGYHKGNPESKNSEFFLDRVDRTQPCVPLIRLTDSIDVQKYIRIKKEILIPEIGAMYLLVEYNGDSYRTMDKAEYISKATGSAITNKILLEVEELNRAADKLREYYESLAN